MRKASRALWNEPEVRAASAKIARMCWPLQPRMFLTTDELEKRYLAYREYHAGTFAEFVDPWRKSGLLIITE